MSAYPVAGAATALAVRNTSGMAMQALTARGNVFRFNRFTLTPAVAVFGALLAAAQPQGGIGHVQQADLIGDSGPYVIWGLITIAFLYGSGFAQGIIGLALDYFTREPYHPDQVLWDDRFPPEAVNARRIVGGLLETLLTAHPSILVLRWGLRYTTETVQEMEAVTAIEWSWRVASHATTESRSFARIADSVLADNRWYYFISTLHNYELALALLAKSGHALPPVYDGSALHKSRRVSMLHRRLVESLQNQDRDKIRLRERLTLRRFIRLSVWASRGLRRAA